MALNGGNNAMRAFDERQRRLRLVGLTRSAGTIQQRVLDYANQGVTGVECFLDLLVTPGYGVVAMSHWADGTAPLMCDQIGPVLDNAALGESFFPPAQAPGPKGNVKVGHVAGAGKRPHPTLRLTREVLLRRLMGAVMFHNAPMRPLYPNSALPPAHPMPEEALPVPPLEDDAAGEEPVVPPAMAIPPPVPPMPVEGEDAPHGFAIPLDWDDIRLANVGEDVRAFAFGLDDNVMIPPRMRYPDVVIYPDDGEEGEEGPAPIPAPPAPRVYPADGGGDHEVGDQDDVDQQREQRPVIYDMGGSAIRWKRVLTDLLRIGCPIESLPHIHVNAPFNRAEDNTPLRGSTHDREYGNQEAFMQQQFGCFSFCRCVSDIETPLCEHHHLRACTHCVMVDSAYYLEHALVPLSARYPERFFTIHHEYYIPDGSLVQPTENGDAEMDWQTQRDGPYAGCVYVDAERVRIMRDGCHKAWEYGPHWNAKIANGYTTRCGTLLNTEAVILQPLGDHHAYTLCRITTTTGLHAVTRGDARMRMLEDLRPKMFSNIQATSDSVTLHNSDFSGRPATYLLPEGIMPALSQEMGRGVSANAFPNVVRRAVTACSAIPGHEIENTVSYLLFVYPLWRAYFDNLGYATPSHLILSLMCMVVTLGYLCSLAARSPVFEGELWWMPLAAFAFVLYMAYSTLQFFMGDRTIPPEIRSFPEFGLKLHVHGNPTVQGTTDISSFKMAMIHQRATAWAHRVTHSLTKWMAFPLIIAQAGTHKIPAGWAVRRVMNKAAAWMMICFIAAAIALLAYTQDPYQVISVGLTMACFALICVFILMCLGFDVYTPPPSARSTFTVWDKLNSCSDVTFTAMGDDSLIFSATRDKYDVATFLKRCKDTGHAMTVEHSGSPEDALVLSAMLNPMQRNGRPCHVLTNLPGRSLAKAFATNKVVPPKFVDGVARSVAMCNLASFGRPPILGALWQRVLDLTQHVVGKRIPKVYLPDIWQKNGTLAQVGNAQNCTFTAETLAHWQRRYGYSIAEILEADEGARTVPNLKCDYTHPLVRRMVAVDTEYQGVVPDQEFSPINYRFRTTALEEASRFVLSLMGSAGATIFGIGVGVFETAWTGSLLPLVYHGMSAAATIHFGAAGFLAGSVSHFVWNAAIGLAERHAWYPTRLQPQERACVRRRPEAAGLERPYPTKPRPYPSMLVEPTSDVTIRTPTRTLFRHRAKCVKVPTIRPTKYGDVYVTKLEWENPGDQPAEFDPKIGERLDDVPCGPPTQTVHIIGPHTGVYPEVERSCVHGMCMALFERRLKAQLIHRHQKRFAKVCKIIVDPLRARCDEDPLLTGPWEELYTWWVERPQFSEAQRVRLRKAYTIMKESGWTEKDASVTKSFIKLEVVLKRLFKSRAITCMEDFWNILIAPAVQRAAFVVGPLLAPGVYKTLPGAPNLNLVWLKGDTAENLGNMLAEMAGNSCHALGTDGVSWDGSHTIAQLNNVDVFTKYAPRCIQDMYRNRRHKAKARVNVGSRRSPRWVTFSTALDGSLFTGQPDVSLSNTLVRLPVDVYGVACQ